MAKILTVRQPWASMIMAGIKDVENRSWNTPYRGEIVIHAGRVIDPAGMREIAWLDRPMLPEELPTGVILGAVDLVDIRSDSASMWAEGGAFHWIFSKRRVVLPAPVAHRGQLGLIEFTEPWGKILDNGYTVVYR